MNNLSPMACFRYASLLFKLFFPLTVLRWVVMLVAALWVLGLVLHHWQGWDLLIMLATPITGLMAFMFLMLMPNQVIALASSRPVGLLGNSRRVLLLYLFVCAALISGLLYWALRFNRVFNADISLLVVIWLTVSLLLQVCIFLCSRWPNGQFIIFMLAWVWLQFAAWLSTQNPLLLLFAWAASWLLFARWWLVWHPQKYQPNSMVAVINDAQQVAAARNAGFLFRATQADTWLGSRLFGVPDGWRARRQRLVIGILFFLLAPIPAYWLMGKQLVDTFFQHVLMLAMICLVATVAQGMAVNFIRNLRNIWLYCPEGRQDLLRFAGAIYAREIGIWSLATIGVVLALELWWGQWHGARVWVCSLVFILLINVTSFYLVCWVYLRSQGSALWCNAISGIAVLLWVALFMASGLLFPLPFNWQGIAFVWVWLPPLVVLVLLYQSVRAGFSRMNLVRVE